VGNDFFCIIAFVFNQDLSNQRYVAARNLSQEAYRFFRIIGHCLHLLLSIRR